MERQITRGSIIAVYFQLFERIQSFLHREQVLYFYIYCIFSTFIIKHSLQFDS